MDVIPTIMNGRLWLTKTIIQLQLKLRAIVRTKQKESVIMANIKEIEERYLHANASERENIIGVIEQEFIVMTVKQCRLEGININSKDDFKSYFDAYVGHLISKNDDLRRFLTLMVHHLYNIDKRGFQACFEMYIDSAAERYMQIKNLI